VSEAVPLGVSAAVRSVAGVRSDAPVVALAVSAWIGATVSAPLPTVVVIGTGLAAAVVARSRAGSPGRLVVACAALGLLTSGLGARSLAGLEPREVGDVEAVVALVTDPEPTPTGRLRAEVRLDGRRLLAEARSPAAIEVLAPRLAGDRVALRGVVEPLASRPGWVVARHVAGRLRIESVVAVADGAPHASAANGLRRVLERGASSLPDRHRALLAGLTLGDERGQPAELAADFRASGLTHLLAVSGQNLVFILAVAGPLLRRLGIWPRFVAAVALVVGFAFLTRFEPSVVRAAAVAAVALWASTAGRPSGGLRHLALAVCGLLVVDPLLTRSVGFRLSVTACLGVLLLAPPIVARLPGPRWVREALGMTAGAQLAVAPVLVPTFGAMPIAALPANVAAAPLAGALMVWGVTGGVVAGVVGGTAAQVLHLPSRIGLLALEHVASMGGSLPLGHVDLRHLVVVTVAALLVARGGRPARSVALALLVLVLAVPATMRVPAGAEPAGWAATVWSDGPVAIVDLEPGASGVEVLDVLRRRRVHLVSLVVVRAGRPELAEVVESIRARLPVQAVLAPAGAPIPGHVVPRPGFQTQRAGFDVRVEGVSPVLDVRIGRARTAAGPGQR
jgi:competence protein ComEC